MTAETTIPDLALAGDATFEEAAYLLLYKHIPKRSELISFRARLGKAGALPLQVVELIRVLRHARPMSVLRSAVSALGAVQEQQADRAERIDARERLIARLPVIIATHHALRSGLPLPVPDTTHSYSRNLLAMFRLEHDERRGRMTDLLLITQAESGAGAAGFAARVVGKTQADVYAAITAAVGALDGLTKGPTERFLKMIEEIGTPERVAEYLKAKRIPAFANEDPRARDLKAATQELGATVTLRILEELARFGADPGINGYAITLAQRLGFPDDLVVPLSAVSRVSGWLADIDDELGGSIMTDLAMFLEDAGLFTPEVIEQLASGQRHYAGVNPGDSNVQTGRLLDAVRHHEWLQPVRSGRIGNWGPIWSGSSPLLAYNRAVTADLGLARPVIHSLTRTETDDLSAGDTVYRPGSLLAGGVLQQLVLTSPLVGWQDLDPRVPRFVPWTWGRVSVGPVNLVHLHGEPTRLRAPIPVLDEGDLFWQHHSLVRQWLTRLWERAADESAGGDISWLFGRGVRRDASICPLRVRRDGSIFVLSCDEGGTWEKVGEAGLLTDRCLLPYRVVAQADVAESLVRTAPEVTPLLSARLSKAILGYLGASCPGAATDPYARPTSFAMLVEWGALSQGGFPPVRPGVFAGKGYQQLTRLTVTALAQANDLPALAYVMLPLAPLVLMPSTARPLDVAWLASFFQEIAKLPGDAQLDDAMAVYRGWEKADAVSGFYRDKFSGLKSVAPHELGEVAAQTIEQVEVRALTLRQSGLAVAALFNAWATS